MVNEPLIESDHYEMSVENDDGGQHNNIYDSMKAQPRRQYKSRAIRTLFSVYEKKKKFKLLTMG